MNKTLCTMVMMTSVLLGSCNCENGKVDTGKGQDALIGKSEMKIDDGRMTAEALWAMGRIGGVKYRRTEAKSSILSAITVSHKTRATASCS